MVSISVITLMQAGNLLLQIGLTTSTELHGNMTPTVSSSINMMITGRKLLVDSVQRKDPKLSTIKKMHSGKTLIMTDLEAFLLQTMEPLPSPSLGPLKKGSY